MFSVRFGGAERRLSRAALIDEVRAGTVPGEAMVSSAEFFGDGGWRRLDETSLWRICQARAGTSSALVPVDGTSRLDLVPTNISMEVCADAGVDEPYMLEMCRVHGITARQLHHLVGMMTCFQTDIRTMHRLLNEGLSLDEIEELYDARDGLRSSGGASFTKLVRFYRAFFDGTNVPGSFMASEIMDARARLDPDGYVDTILEILCDAADRLNACNLEFVVEELARRKPAEG